MNLAKIVFIGATWLALAVPAEADITLSGYGELGTGGGFYHVSPDYVGSISPNYNGSIHALGTMSGAAHVNLAFDNGVNLQFDAEGQKDFFDLGDSFGGIRTNGFDKSTTYGFGAHFNLGDDDYRFGFLGSMGNVEWGNGAYQLYSTGLEGAWFLDRTTLFSQLVYSDTRRRVDLRSLFLRMGARYFLEDNLMLGAHLGAGVIDATPSTSYMPFPGSPPSSGISALYLVGIGGRGGIGNGNMLNWGTGAEYRFTDWPLSLGFDYRGSYATWRNLDVITFYWSNGSSYSCNGSLTYHRTEHLFMVRLRYYFGLESLFANDRKGASMNDYNPWYGAEPIAEADSGISGWPPPAC